MQVYGDVNLAVNLGLVAAETYGLWGFKLCIYGL
jgi:hypothetical protein